ARITPITFKVVLLAILLFDLWRIDSRPMDPVTKEQAFAVFNKSDVDDFLNQDSTKYRIMDLTQQPAYPARQFHENVLGYSSTKMRIYQDLMDVTSKDGSGIESQTALEMLNTKYIVSFEQPGQEPVFRSKDRSEQGHPVVVYKNPKALPRAWFVNKVETAPKLKTLEMLRDNTFDPHDVAYVVNPLPSKVDPVGYAASAPAAPTDSTHPAPAAGSGGNGTVAITRWEPNSFSLDVNAPGPGSNFLVISEIYYPPSWKATIDGKPAEVYQTNYLLRGLIVPAGKHTVEMHYESAGFDSGRYTSLALNIVTIVLIGLGIVMERRTRHRDEEDPVHNAPEILEDDV
ncbi:MAG: YfhO family protein, partial [Bacteroidota bacterium]